MVLNISNLTVHLNGRRILHEVALEVGRGEFMALLGDNGAGKTTLLRSILGLVPLTAGIICLFGRRFSWWNKNVLRQRIGYIPQVLQFDETMPVSAREIIAIGRCARAGLARRLKQNDLEIIEASADIAGVGRLLDRPIGQLSGGERQKVQIARVLCQQPELLLLDEFSSHLATDAREECLQLLERLHREKCFTIIMVTHDVSLIPDCCRRAIVLAEGQKLFDGNINEWRRFNRDNGGM